IGRPAPGDPASAREQRGMAGASEELKAGSTTPLFSAACRLPPAAPRRPATAGPATWLVGGASRTFTAGPSGRLPVATRRD
ncbi:hypothetical protein ABZ737_10485, partial [Streptomyces sp. NPDC013087]